MKLIFFSLIAFVLFFFLLVFIFICIDRLSKQLIAGQRQAPKKSSRKYAKLKSFFLNFVIITMLCALAIFVVHLSRSLRFQSIAKKATRIRMKSSEHTLHKDVTRNKNVSSNAKQKRAARHLTPLTERKDTASESPEDTYRSTTLLSETAKNTTHDALTAEISAFNSFESDFTPSTIKFNHPLLSQKKSTNSHEEEAKQESTIVAKLDGAQPGDIFLCSLYDQIEKGNFTKSEQLRLLQSTPQLCNTIGVNIHLPLLKKNEIIQLPFLLNGYVVSQYSEDQSFILDSQGSLELLKDRQEGTFHYELKKCSLQQKIIFYPGTTEWLEKEFHDIPQSLKGFLDAVKDQSDFVKLATVASILNTYFGYQAGLQDVHLENDDTWNTMLNTTLKQHRKLLCDCDVLSTFAFIYLKYLDLKPVLLIGYINSPDKKDVLALDELHATLNVNTQEKWMIFEPTLFTTNFSSLLAEKKATSSTTLNIIEQTDDPIIADFEKQRTFPAGILKYSLLDFFHLPPHFMKQLTDVPHETPTETKLAMLIVELLSFQEPIATAVEHDSSVQNDYSLIVVQSSILVYILSIVFIKLLSFLQGYKKIIFPLPKVQFYVYNLLVSAVLSCMFIDFRSAHVNMWVPTRVAITLGAAICLIAGIASTSSVLYLLLTKGTATPSTQRVKKVFQEKNYLVIGALFSFAAILYSSSSIIFFICPLIILFVVFKLTR
ncbi:hypothetical protein ACFL38_00735 [Candidatus Omnitrophota bacterium]